MRYRSITLIELSLGVASLTFSGFLYAIYRPTTLLYELLHEYISTLEFEFPLLSDFMIYNLPGGLCSIAFILIVDALLRKNNYESKYIPIIKSIPKLAIASIVPITGTILELLQMAHLIPGTFDIADMFCYLVPFALYAMMSKPE